MRKTLYLLLLFTLLSGCTMFVKEPVVTLKDVGVTTLDGRGAVVEISLNVKNTNRFEVRLSSYSYDLKVMELPLAKGEARAEIKFPSGAATDLRIPIRISYRDLLEVLKRKPDLDSVPYRLTAVLDLETPLGHLSVPVKRNGTYAVPKQYRSPSMLNRLTDFFMMNK